MGGHPAPRASPTHRPIAQQVSAIRPGRWYCDVEAATRLATSCQPRNADRNLRPTRIAGAAAASTLAPEKFRPSQPSEHPPPPQPGHAGSDLTGPNPATSRSLLRYRYRGYRARTRPRHAGATNRAPAQWDVLVARRQAKSLRSGNGFPWRAGGARTSRGCRHKTICPHRSPRLRGSPHRSGSETRTRQEGWTWPPKSNRLASPRSRVQHER